MPAAVARVARELLARVALAGMIALPVGAAYAAAVARVAYFPDPFPDRLVLALWLAAALCAVAAVLLAAGAPVVLAVPALRRRAAAAAFGHRLTDAALACALAIAILFFAADRTLGDVFFRIDRLEHPYRWWLEDLAFGALLGGGVITAGAFAAARLRTAPTVAAHLLAALLALALGAAWGPQPGPFHPACAPPLCPGYGALDRQATGVRVVVVGLDGASWNVWDPMLAAGNMPFVHDFLAAGAAAPLASEWPYQSPVVWTTLATGRPPAEHGICSFLSTRLPGCRFVPVESPEERWLYPFYAAGDLLHRCGVGETTPVTRDLLRVPPLWQIVSDAGGSASVLNAFATSPCAPLHGHCLSDVFFREVLWLRFPNARPMAGVHPAELAARLRPLLRDPGTRDPDSLSAYGDFSVEDRREFALSPLDPDLAAHPLFQLAWSLGVEENVFACARRLLTDEPDDLTFLVSGLEDEVNHYFLEYRWPERYPVVDATKIGRWGKVVDEHHRALDRRLEALWKTLPAGSVMLVVSDHGARFGVRWPALIHAHGPEGVFLARGWPFRAGLRPEPLRLIDIAPTVLYLLGYEVPAALRGAVRTDLLDPGFVLAHPVRRR